MTVASAVVSVKGGAKFFLRAMRKERKNGEKTRKEDGEMESDMNEGRWMRCR